MTCEDLEARIAEFLAGELEDRSGVEEHLVACAECRGQFSTARSGWQAADEWSVSGPSGDAIAATLTALEPVAPSKPLLRFLQAGTMAASLVIAFVIGTSNREKPAAEKPAPVVANPVRTAAPGPSGVVTRDTVPVAASHHNCHYDVVTIRRFVLFGRLSDYLLSNQIIRLDDHARLTPPDPHTMVLRWAT